MSLPVIKVEQLTKKFILQHESQERYRSLREVISKRAVGLFKRNETKASSQEEFYALKDVSFDIQQGDRVGIIGRNGAGKSTLLKILSRITEPSKGKISIRGRVASLLEVGTGFHPELTGRENIFLNGAILGMGRAEIKKKFDEIVDFAEVEKFLDTPVKRYSSGMYVRLAFAVAANLEPEILIVDEVLAVGDSQFQKKCLGKMEDVSKNDGRTVLFVSHQMDAVESLTQKCIYLKEGTIFKTGPTKEIVDSYLNNYLNNQEIKYFKDRKCNEKARVIKFQILKNGNPVNSVKQGEPFEVLLGIEVQVPMDVNISVAIENFRQQPLFCSQLSDLQKPVRRDKYFETIIQINEPKLRTGNYSVSMAVFKPDQSEFYDVVNHFPMVNVEGLYENAIFPIDYRIGDLYFPFQWKID